MTQNQEIRNWNLERCIPQVFDVQAEVAMLLEEIGELLQAKTPGEVADALCDIKVLASGALAKAGFDADVAMDETIKEISDRGGYYDVATGKWLKVPTRSDQYKADYSKAAL